ncbi:MAG: serine/threonine protein phosphatase [Marinilabiliaceae bacterium]|nr:serine/threonine protein phosphatase [Marinilabiliaceae bacterium]
MSGRLLAIGDIHGCYGPLRELVEDKLQLTSEDTLVFIGDYIDRGPQSRDVLDYIIKLRESRYKIITLKGNHEWMLLKARQEDVHLINWLYNGGHKTLDSFNVRHPDMIPDPYIEFCHNLEMFHQVGPFIFVHAGFNNDIDDPFSDEHQMIWTRQEDCSHPLFAGKIIIHGHTVNSISDLQYRMNTRSGIINIDTGCVYPHKSGCGVLSAVDLTNWELFSVSNK